MAKLEAKWVYLDSNTLEDDGAGNIQAKLDPDGNLSATTSGIKIDVQNPFDMNSNRITNLADGVNDTDAVNLSQLQAVAKARGGGHRNIAGPVRRRGRRGDARRHRFALRRFRCSPWPDAWRR